MSLGPNKVTDFHWLSVAGFCLLSAMASALEEFLICAICMETLEKPKILVCAHSFCLSCLESLSGIDDHICCPSCRRETPLGEKGVHGLTDDFRMIQLKDSLEQMKPKLEAKPPPEKRCDVCNDLVANVCCTDCNKKMCKKCVGLHSMFDDKLSHTVLKIDDVTLCPKHSVYCSHVCSSCRRLVCRDCISKDCTKHKYRGIGDMARACLKEGEDNFIRLLDRRTHAEMKKQSDIFEGLKLEVKHRCVLLISRIEEKKEELLRDLASKERKHISALKAMTERDLVRARKMLESSSGCTDAGSDMREGIPSELIHLMLELKSTDMNSQPLIPTPRFIPGELDVNIGQLDLQNSASMTDIGLLTAETQPGTLDALLDCVPNRNPPISSDDIVFSKIVEDTRRDEDCWVVACFEKYIIRLELLTCDEFRCIQIYERNIHRGYYEERDFIEHSENSLDENDVAHLEYLKDHLYRYIMSRADVFAFDKVVHDRRGGSDKLMARKDDFIIVQNRITNQCEVFASHIHPYYYLELDDLVNRFYHLDISGPELEGMAKSMITHLVSGGLIAPPLNYEVAVLENRPAPFTTYFHEEGVSSESSEDLIIWD